MDLMNRALARIRAYIKVCFIPLRIKKNRKIADINRFEARIFSQNGETGIVQAVFCAIGTTNKFFVEFGVESGHECNTRFLYETQNWKGLLMDGGTNNPPRVKKEFITAENINELFRKYNVPYNFDLLSIDIDFNDYWVWKALDAKYSPRVIVMEYNSKIPPDESKAVSYDPYFKWDGTDYCGASLLALVNLGKVKGYTLVGCESRGVNAFFVRSDIAKEHFIIKSPKELYRPPGWGNKVDGLGHPPSNKKMIRV